MARPIGTNESVQHAVRRLARAELSSALRRLRESDASLNEQIHAARTAIKKVRSLARLVRPAVKDAGKENRRLRRIARTLSDVRDAHVQRRALHDLLRGSPDAQDPSIQQIEAMLSERWTDARQAFADAGGRKNLRRRLRKARRRVKRWLPAENRWAAFGPGFLQGYDRAQQAMREAYRSKDVFAKEVFAKDVLAFHAWRRTVKSHRHQVHALVQLFPEDFKTRLDRLDDLDQLLGDEHDLSALKETVRQNHFRVRWNERCDELLKELNDRRARLRSRARALGTRLFARKAKTLRRQLKTHLNKAA